MTGGREEAVGISTSRLGSLQDAIASDKSSPAGLVYNPQECRTLVHHSDPLATLARVLGDPAGDLRLRG